MSTTTAIKSPCINVCVIDETARMCRGCGRTLAEIVAWRDMNDATRAQVMDMLADRLAGLEESGS